MKIHKVILQSVKQFRELALDLSSPLTIITGPIGVGKTTLQKAILTAMFQAKKQDRDKFVSRFDPHSAPTATIFLSRKSVAEPTIRLFRRLTDDSGEWEEDSKVIKQKGKALEKVQETLPISLDAAYSLLWGLQEDMAAIVDNFPPDGHTLLTAATVKGAGPDPKVVIANLEKEFKEAKARGKNPGSLSQADDNYNSVEEELENAKEAEEKRRKLREKYDEAKSELNIVMQKHNTLRSEVKRLSELEKLVDNVIETKKELSELRNRQNQWDTVTGDIETANRKLKSLQSEVDELEKQYKFLKNKELGQKMELLSGQIRTVKEANEKCENLKSKLISRRRPEKSEEGQFKELRDTIEKATEKIEATGLRYELSSESGSKSIILSEDNGVEKEVRIDVNKSHSGVVGKVNFKINGLKIAASGKSDIGSLKNKIKARNKEITKFIKLFEVVKEEGFHNLVEETKQLKDALKEAKSQFEKELKGSTVSTLQSELDYATNELEELKVPQEVIDAYAGKFLGDLKEVQRNLYEKNGEVKIANNNLQELHEKKPTDAEANELDEQIEQIQESFELATNTFEEADDAHRDCTPETRNKIKSDLEKKRQEIDDLNADKSTAENEVTRILTSLKISGSERTISSIETDLDEAKIFLHREQVNQSARQMLISRVAEKISEMSANVPQELGERISKHIATLTNGSYSIIGLSDTFGISSIGEGGERSERWQPNELSHGERHVTALALKIAVAQALSELSDPIFIILDDSLVAFDPEHRTTTEKLLVELSSQGKVQIILLTCHTDWAADWKRRAGEKVNLVQLQDVAKYYR